MKFIQIKSDTETDWALFIDNDIDFKKFLEDKATDLTNAYNLAKESVSKWREVTHCGVVPYCIGIELDKYPNRKTFVDDVMIYCQTFLKPFITLYNKEGKLIVWQGTSKWNKQKYAGCMPYSAIFNHPLHIEIIKTIERDDLIFPLNDDEEKYSEKDISIKKWDEGNHYYAKIKHIDVVIDDIVKWNTYDEAMRNAKIYLSELNNG